MEKPSTFDGKVLLFAGDFPQIFPVVLSGFQAQIFNACVKALLLHERFRIIRLCEKVRLEWLFHDVDASEEAMQFPQLVIIVVEGNLLADDGCYLDVLQYI